MKDWRDTVVGPDATVRHTIQRIDTGSMQIALVVDAGGRLLGTVTDGDVRRALLRGVTLDAPVQMIMNSNPTRAFADQERQSILSMMQARGLHQIPVIDRYGILVALEVLDELLRSPRQDNWVVLMAGGLGVRLRPLTDECPKPMLRVGDRPLLEHIIEAFVSHGYRHFFVSVNYRADVIQEYFGDGSRWDAEIEYLQEHEPLGTAGALSLLNRRPDRPLFVMNGDLLTKVNFNHVLQFHAANKATATMCIRNYEYQIPYGVVAVDGHQLVAIDEKPKQRCFVSAGIYLLSPEALESIPSGQFLDMPSLFEQLIHAGKTTAAFPVREYWLDIGKLEDFERANGDFQREFR